VILRRPGGPSCPARPHVDALRTRNMDVSSEFKEEFENGIVQHSQ
jgi:hypothetical protein